MTEILLSIEVEAKYIMDKIRRSGMALFVPIGFNGSKLINFPNQCSVVEDIRMDAKLFRELTTCPYLDVLTANTNGCKLGWKELGLPGDKGDLICSIS